MNEALRQGRRIATNLDLELHNLPYVDKFAKNTDVTRVPDLPTAADIEAIGYGIKGVRSDAEALREYDEKRFGLLVLDECGTWFNSRDWQETGRRELVNFLLHIRKRGWDVYLIIQDISMLDKQARKALAEHVVYCRRLDRLTIPLVGFLWQRFTGNRMPMPRLHVAHVKYGDQPQSLTVERWIFRGDHLFHAYDTTQVFRADYPHGIYSVLPPFYRFAHMKAARGWRFAMRLTRIYLRQYSRTLLLAAGVAAGGMVTAAYVDTGETAGGSVGVVAESNVQPSTGYQVINEDEPVPRVDPLELRIKSFFSMQPADAEVVFTDGNRDWSTPQLAAAGLRVVLLSNPCQVRVAGTGDQAPALLRC